MATDRSAPRVRQVRSAPRVRQVRSAPRVRQVPPARYLQRAKDLVDSRYADPITVDDLAAAAGLSRAHFSRMFTRTFGESPRSYLQTRRLERAAALLRYTDRSVADICVMVGLHSVGSFTTNFTRVYGLSPLAYRAAMPPAVMHARVPSCVLARDTRPRAGTRGEQQTADNRGKTARGKKTDNVS
jgi:AraC-like DNA-binding protein